MTIAKRHHGVQAWFQRMYRLPQRGICGGVIAGIADYYDWNPRLLRAVAIVATLAGISILIPAYCVLWYVLDPAVDGDHPDSRTRRAHHAEEPDDEAETGVPSSADLKSRLQAIDGRLRSLETVVTNRDFHLRRAFHELESQQTI